VPAPAVPSLTMRPLDPSRSEAWPPWAAALADQVDRGAARAAVLAVVAGQVAAARGHPLDGLALRLVPGDDRPALPPLPPALAVPDVLGALDQHLLDPADRRARGAHYTSPDLALALLGWALADWDPGPTPRGPLRVLDAAVGGGAFLLAAARWQVTRGAEPAAVLAGLVGTDVDPLAVAVAEAALVLWALDHGVEPGGGARPDLQVGDGLDHRPPPPVDLVVGNPPFLGQLARATARAPAEAARLRARFGTAVGGYTDTAALFLVAGCEAARPGGRVVLVQPESVLGTRDGRGVRAAVAARADVVGLWVAGEPAFAAEVDVCVPVLEVRRPGRVAAPDATVRRAWGTEVAERPPSRPPASRSWASLLAVARGVPEVALAGGGCVGDLATATAGFRQHFYGLVPHLRELPDGAPSPFGPGGGPDRAGDEVAPLVTVGTVDPLALLWGLRPTKVAGRSWLRPVVDLGAVAAAEPDVERWVRARLRPKVLVAPQTRVVEAAVDAAGRAVPGVPLVTVEPQPGAGRAVPPPPPDACGAAPPGEEEWVLWLLAAALSAPPVSAWALYETAGTARHGDAVKLAARQVRAVPLPVDGDRWAIAAAALRAGRPLAEVGPDLTRAYGLDPDHPVTAWWAARLPGGRADG